MLNTKHTSKCIVNMQENNNNKKEHHPYNIMNDDVATNFMFQKKKGKCCIIAPMLFRIIIIEIVFKIFQFSNCTISNVYPYYNNTVFGTTTPLYSRCHNNVG